MKIADVLDADAWRGFVDTHPQGNIFQTPEMARVFARAHGCRPAALAALGDDGAVLALLPAVQVTLMNGPLRRLTTRSILYGGALCADGPDGAPALEAALRAHEARGGREALFTEVRHLSDPAPLGGTLGRCGYVYEEHLNYLIDLRGSPADVLGRIGARTRKHIRQALRKGAVVVDEICSPELLREWYALVERSYTGARVPLADFSLFEAAFHELLPLGMIQFWLARVDGVPAAASAELLYKDTIYGWYSGVDRSYAAECPGELLMWRVLETGAQAGFGVYDFGGAGKPGETYGVRDFKAKFGGELVCYGRHRRVHHPGLLRLSEWGYQAYRKIKSLRA
jgi:CelD/BcsL family acetyltransferase involved in cellulose biosynthesis